MLRMFVIVVCGVIAAIAVALGWVLSGRERPAIVRRAIE